MKNNELNQLRLKEILDKCSQQYNEINDRIIEATEDEDYNKIIDDWEKIDKIYGEATKSFNELKNAHNKCKNKIKSYKKGFNP